VLQQFFCFEFISAQTLLHFSSIKCSELGSRLSPTSTNEIHRDTNLRISCARKRDFPSGENMAMSSVM
jgi:hypothetical protein